MMSYLTPILTNPLFQLVLATVCGMAIGVEREISGKPAGVRTCSLVCVGSTLFAIASYHFSVPPDFISAADPTRIAAQIVSGIGFLGAGVILIDKGHKVVGLTTAAAVWVVAAIGMAIGFVMYKVALETTVLTIIIMFGIGAMERRFGKKANRH